MATLVPEGTDWHGMLVEMGQRWKEATNGQIVLRIYPGGVVGDERDMIRKIRIGQIHAAAVSTEGLSEINFMDLDFRKSKTLIRLNTLRDHCQSGRLDNDLYWVK